jgi:hypothetical protein
MGNCHERMDSSMRLAREAVSIQELESFIYELKGCLMTSQIDNDFKAAIAYQAALEINDRIAVLTFAPPEGNFKGEKSGHLLSDSVLANALNLDAIWFDKTQRGAPISHALLKSRDQAAGLVVKGLGLPKPPARIDQKTAQRWASQLDLMFRNSWGCRLCKWSVQAILNALASLVAAAICSLWPVACPIAGYLINLIKAGLTGLAAEMICKKLKKCK